MDALLEQNGSHQPVVSIIIPFYSTYLEYFDECLRSVAEQTYHNCELVVVDDASPAGGAEQLLAKYSYRNWLFLRHEKNRGQAAARNTGIQACSGRYFMPLDCDDLIAPTHVENLVRALLTSAGASVAYADYHLFFDVNKTLELPVGSLRSLLQEQWIPHPGTLFEKELWQKAGGYSEEEIFRSGNEDWEFFLRCAELGFTAVRVPEATYYYRQHASSISTLRFAQSDYLMRQAMYERHQQLFDKSGMKAVFLGGGYRVSALAFWRGGQRLKALALMARALGCAPSELLRILARRTRRAMMEATS